MGILESRCWRPMIMRRSGTSLMPLWVVVVMAAALVYSAPGSRAGEVEVTPAKTLLDKALRDFEKREDALAEEACKRVIAIYPGRECEARLILAEVYYAQGRFENAMEQVQRAYERAQWDGDAEGAAAALEAMGRFATREQHLCLRAAELENAMSAGPEKQGIDAQIELGDLLAAWGRTKQGIAHYRAVVDKYPDRAESVGRAMAKLQHIYVREEGAEVAVSKLTAILVTHLGTEAEACAGYEIGRVYESEGQDQRAIAHYTNVPGRFPDSPFAPMALEGILGIYKRTRQFLDAINTAQKIIDTYPASDSALRAVEKLGEIYAELGTLEEAMVTFRSIIRHDPESAVALRSLEVLCELYAEAGRLAEAVAMLDAARSEYPDKDWRSSRLAGIYYQHGRELRLKGQKASAVSWWEKEVSLQDNATLRAEAIIRIGIAYTALREYQKARAALQVIIDSDARGFRERHLLAQDVIASSYWHEGDLENALKSYEKELDMARRRGQTDQEKVIRGSIEKLKTELSQRNQ